MLFSHSVLGGVRTGRLPVFGPPHHRQDREERQAETTADVQERSRGTTATRRNLTLSAPHGGWRTVPEGVRRAVLTRTRVPGDRSATRGEADDLVRGLQRGCSGDRAG